MKRVAIYSRVSTDEQHTSIENQQEIFNNWISRNKDCTIVKRYVDEGISGTKVYKRTAFLKMLEDSKNKEFDILLCKSFSRFGRNQAETLTAIKNLRAKGIRIIFIEDNLDTNKDTMQFGLFGWLAEQESQKTSNRIKTVFNTFKQQGKIYNCRSPYGYNYSKEKKNFVVNIEQAEIVKKIFNMYISGYGFCGIAKELESRNIPTQKGGNWRGNTIKNIILNEVYCGTLVQNKSTTIDVTIKETKKNNVDKWIKHYNNHKAIISYETYNKAQQEFNSRSEFVKNNRVHHTNKNLFSGILFCGDCGTSMTIKRKKSKMNYKPYYICNKYSLYSKKCGHSSNAIWEDVLVDFIKDNLNNITKNKYRQLKEMLKEKDRNNNKKLLENSLKRINKELEKQTKQSTKLLDLLVNGKVQEEQFALMNNEIAKQITILNKQKKELETKIKKQDNTKAEQMELKQGIEMLINTPTENWTNTMLRAIINKVEVSSDDTINIFYKYIN